MYYVEFLRVFRTLRIFTIVLGAVLLVAFISRLSLGTHWNNLWIEHYNVTPSGHKTVEVGADGTETTKVDDPAGGLRIVQVRTAGMLVVTVYESQRRFEKSHMGSSGRGRHRQNIAGQNSPDGIRIDEYTAPDGTHIIHYINDRHFPADLFIVLCGFFAAVFASVIGGSLSKENDGHLELSWTKPVSRQTLAFTLFAIDAAGILAAGLLAFVTALVIEGMFLGRPVLVSSADTAGNLAMAVLFPLAWYAMGQALTASIRRCGIVIGMMWVAAIMSISLLSIPNALLQTILRAINTINPLAYYVTQNGHTTTVNGVSATFLAATQGADILALGAITILAITASLVQWRRLEA
ncbi:MAG: ABC transporter permease [Candidatus Eremiobacteraeota bacterium]|nr:ABC transporter permease [Candidatus Eremiobacteraeota bacterium]